MIPYIFPLIMAAIGISALLFRQNLIKKIIGLGVLTNSIHLLLITIGFRGSIRSAVPPILPTPEVTAQFLTTAVDPLPQAIVLTSIVINLSILAVMLAIAIHAYRQFGTLRTREWDDGGLNKGQRTRKPGAEVREPEVREAEK